MNIKNYRIASLEFRRIASNMLTTDFDNATMQLIRFKQYIDSNARISRIIQSKISEIEYDFKKCFLVDNSEWNKISPPIDEAFHLKAQYDYISYICSNNICIRNVACGFYRRSNNMNDIVRDFLNDAFKPLIDLTDSLSKEIMLLEEERPMGNITQTIDKNYGTVNAAGGDIKSSTTTIINDIGEIKELIEKLLPTISASGFTQAEKEDLADDLETISEQIESDKPKVSRIRKAYENIKGFIVKASNGAVNTTLLLGDWQKLIEKLRELIESIK